MFAYLRWFGTKFGKSLWWTLNRRNAKQRGVNLGTSFESTVVFPTNSITTRNWRENSPKNGSRLLINVKSWFSLECRRLIARNSRKSSGMRNYLWWACKQSLGGIHIDCASWVTVFLFHCESKSIFPDLRRTKKGALLSRLKQIESTSRSSNLFRKRRKNYSR